MEEGKVSEFFGIRKTPFGGAKSLKVVVTHLDVVVPWRNMQGIAIIPGARIYSFI